MAIINMARIVFAYTMALAAVGCRAPENVVTTTKTTHDSGDESTVADMTLSSGSDSGDSTAPAERSTGSETTGEPVSSSTSTTGTTAETTSSSTYTTGTTTTTGTTADDGTTGEPTCEAELLADDLSGPWSFSRQGDWIYFTELVGATPIDENDGGVYRVPVDGGTPELLAGDRDGLAIAATPTALFWSEYMGQTMRANLEGDDPQTLGLVGRPIVADATHLFVATTINVHRFPIAGGPMQLLAAAADADWYGSYEIAVDDQRVYWTTGKTVESVGKDGTGPLTLAADQEYTGGVASDGEHVFWLDINNPAGCELRRVPVGGGAVEALWTGDPNNQAPRKCSPGTARIALDDEHVYWGGDLIQRVPKAGGPVELVTECGVRYLRDILVDATHVYWLNFNGVCESQRDCSTGSLLRAPKPA